MDEAELYNRADGVFEIAEQDHPQWTEIANRSQLPDVIMNRHPIELRLLQKSGLIGMQTDAISRVLAELTTREDLARLKADLTWRIIAATGFLATLMALLDVFTR